MVEQSVLLDELLRLEKKYGEASTTIIKDHGVHPFYHYRTNFDSIIDARKQAGCDNINVRKNGSDEKLLEQLRQVANNLWYPTTDRIDKLDDISNTETYRCRFGSMKEAARLAGVDDRIPQGKTTTTREEKMSELRRLEREYGNTRRETIEEHSTIPMSYTSSELRERAGCRTTDYNSTQTKYELIFELRDIEEEFGDTSIETIREHGSVSPAQYQNIFGGIKQARKLANCDVVKYQNRSKLWDRLYGSYNFEEASNKMDGYDTTADRYVYTINCIVGGEPSLYIGQTTDLGNRIVDHNGQIEDDRTPIERVISIESAESLHDVTEKEAKERERERFYEVALKHDTTRVYGGK